MINSRIIEEKIREFVLKNPGTTQYMITKEMEKNHVCATNTAKNMIKYTLIPEKIIIDKQVGNSFHKFYINDESPFNKLMAEIDKAERWVEQLREHYVNYLKKTNVKTGRKLIHLIQLKFYDRISWIAVRINSYIKSPDYRETLYLRLTDVLRKSTRLNSFLTSSNEFIQEMEDLLIVKGSQQAKFYNDLIQYYPTFN